MQYSGATVLLGSSLYLLYGIPLSRQSGMEPRFGWLQKLPGLGAAILLVGAGMSLVTQTGLLAGGFSEGLKIENLQIAVTQMHFGWAAVAQIFLAIAPLVATGLSPASRSLSIGCAVSGALACSSFAWMGHGAATEGMGGYIHLVADIAHSLAAGVWIGALGCFLVLTTSKARSARDDQNLSNGLLGFARIGSAAVGILAFSGAINSWFLIGPNHFWNISNTSYGGILFAKLAVFIGMLFLASLNRYRLAPALETALLNDSCRDKAMGHLRFSVGLESGAAFLVLALVAWLGTLAPANAL